MPEIEKDIPDAEEIIEEEILDEDTAEEAAENNEELEKLQAELDNAKNQYLRIAAEYDNYRKRTQREKDALYVDVTAGSVLVLLPVIDDVERALAVENAGVEDMKKGFDMIANKALDCFSKLGVEAFGAVGDDFDANIHNCIGMTDDGEVESGKVANVIQKGYKMGSKIIRTAMVQVKN